MAIDPLTSPLDFPRINLRQALGKLEKVHANSGNGDIVSVSNAKSAMGYSVKSGNGKTAIAAQKRYGLIDAHESGLCITSSARVILEQKPGSPDRVKALQDASRLPAIFNEIYSAEGVLHEDKHNVVEWLTRDSTISKSDAETIATIFVSNESLIQKELREAAIKEEPGATRKVTVPHNETDRTFATKVANGAVRVFEFDLRPGTKARFEIPFDFSESDYVLLDGILRAMLRGDNGGHGI